MVSAVEVNNIRLLVNEPEADDSPWSYSRLAAILDSARDSAGAVNFNEAAYHVWTQKAAAYAELVDVTESGSTRKLSDLFKNAQAMAAYYRSLIAETPVVADVSNRSSTRPIVRA